MIEYNKNTPVYSDGRLWAREHDEIPQWQQSRWANRACAEAIGKAIKDSYHFQDCSAEETLDKIRADFSMERIEYVLASTIRNYDWDERYADNRDWANWHRIVPDIDGRVDSWCCVSSGDPHPIFINEFVSTFRREQKKQLEGIKNTEDKNNENSKSETEKAETKEKQYFSVAYSSKGSQFTSVNIAHAYSVEDVKECYKKWSNLSIEPYNTINLEADKRKGKPIVEIGEGGVKEKSAKKSKGMSL